VVHYSIPYENCLTVKQNSVNELVILNDQVVESIQSKGIEQPAGEMDNNPDN